MKQKRKKQREIDWIWTVINSQVYFFICNINFSLLWFEKKLVYEILKINSFSVLVFSLKWFEKNNAYFMNYQML